MLAGGESDPNSPANKLEDKSYTAFVSAFNFVEYGAGTTARDAVQKDTLKLYAMKTETGLLASSRYFIDVETSNYLAKVVDIRSIDDLMAIKCLSNYALVAYGFDPATEKAETIRTMLEGGVSDPNSPANKSTDKRYTALVTAFNFMEHGEAATPFQPRPAALDRQVSAPDSRRERRQRKRRRPPCPLLRAQGGRPY